MKITVVVEQLAENKYQVVLEDDVAVTTVTTSAPQKYIMNALSKLGVKGKRGRPKGSTIKSRGASLSAVSFLADGLPSVPTDN